MMIETLSVDTEREREEFLMDAMLRRPAQLLLASTIGRQDAMLIIADGADDPARCEAVSAALEILWDAYLPPDARRFEVDWAALLREGRA